jgi:hypothetical protein
MSRKALLAALAVSFGLFVSTPSFAQNTPPPGAAQPQTVVPMQLNPYYLYPSGVQPVPMLVTPTASFDSPPPTAGVSNAGRAGISVNNPVNTGLTSTLPPSTMVYTNVQPEVAIPAPANAPPEAAGNESGGRLINDMGPSYYADALPAANNVSLGEVARQFKASKPAVNARRLTNEEVVAIVSTQTGVTLAKNMPPLGPSVAVLMGQPQGGSAQAGPTQNAPTNQPGQKGATAQAGTPPPAPAGQEANSSATTPQINQKPQSNDTQGNNRLPATSTFLPLLGILGAVSGGIGLWFRRFRK